ncbi:DNA polymerase subunit gamma-1 [Brachionus plicatilis]|uniref:DNA polymerase subunit gamma-1 n=1 Tax=Brachionus plicatilis TaxID=10195 RepID=A0A3M7PSE3_BRAPC|nr:DNA polymerase subunit gamma-1 [Brachionus plicatilis]
MSSNVNNLGIRMLNPKLRKYLFNRRNKINPDIEKNILSSLSKFDLIDEKKLASNVQSTSTNTLEELELPKIAGRNIDEHIHSIADDQINTYLRYLNLFSNQRIPPIPSSFKFEPGWTRYDPVTGKTSQVEYPDEDALVLDVECLVKYQNMPVMATALSSRAWYSWCSERLIKNDFKYVKNLQLSDLIPLESEEKYERKKRKRIVIGHNVGFDRSFIKQQYYLEKSAMRFLDTMSMHIACSGFTHEQRDAVFNIQEEQSQLNKSDNGDFSRISRPGFLWSLMGSLNNLKDVHRFYCADSKTKMNKETRNIFVNGEPEDIINDYQFSWSSD